MSGNALADALGITRAAVWKQICALRAMGAPIIADGGRGYRLRWPFEALDARNIRKHLAPAVRQRRVGLDVRWQVDSTSSEMLRQAAAAARDGSACVAEWQAAGRGRRGRQWVSPLGGNVYLSVLKRFACGMGGLAGLSLVAGVVLLETLRALGATGLAVKWPNDIVVDGRKLAGILVEAGGEFLGPCFAVVGIGINLRGPEAALLDQPAAALADACPVLPSRNVLVARLLSNLALALDRFAVDGFAPFAERFARDDVLHGQPLVVHTASGALAGVGAGVDERGALRVRHGARVVRYDSAEVSVRSA